MEEIQGHTTEEGYTIKPPHIFTSSLRHFHCLTAASQKKKKKKSLFVLDAGFSVATAASHSFPQRPDHILFSESSFSVTCWGQN